jgi:uncharacterized membrane protein YgcG
MDKPNDQQRLETALQELGISYGTQLLATVPDRQTAVIIGSQVCCFSDGSYEEALPMTFEQAMETVRRQQDALNKALEVAARNQTEDDTLDVEAIEFSTCCTQQWKIEITATKGL